MKVFLWLRNAWLVAWLLLFVAMWPLGVHGTPETQLLLVRLCFFQAFAQSVWLVARSVYLRLQKRKETSAGPHS